MKKFLICLALIFSLSISCFATEYETVEDLISDVNDLVVVNDAPQDYVDNNEPVSISYTPTENGSVGNGDEVALLNEIALTLNEMEAGSLFNINSSQVEYFKGILLDNPFWDYCITFDGEQTYRLYYGHDIVVGGSANMAYITRVSSGTGYNYNYQVVTGSSGTVPSGNVYVSTISDGMPIFEEVENAKAFKTLQIACCVALALWLLGRILFR